jgi:hypothetical protein
MKNKIIKNVLLFGSLAATCCVIVALIQYYALHVSPFGRYKAPAYGINIIFIFISIWYYRIKNDGLLSFGEGVVLGFFTNLIAAFLTGLVLYLFVQLIDAQPLTLWVNENLKSVEMMKEIHIKQFSQESFDKLLTQSKLPISPSTVFFDEITKKQLCIVAVTLISVILRRHLPTN